MRTDKKEPKVIASLQVKWGKSSYAKVTLTETEDKSSHKLFVTEFCSLVNTCLKRAGVDVPEIGIIDKIIVPKRPDRPTPDQPK